MTFCAILLKAHFFTEEEKGFEKVQGIIRVCIGTCNGSHPLSVLYGSTGCKNSQAEHKSRNDPAG